MIYPIHVKSYKEYLYIVMSCKERLCSSRLCKSKVCFYKKVTPQRPKGLACCTCIVTGMSKKERDCSQGNKKGRNEPFALPHSLRRKYIQQLLHSLCQHLQYKGEKIKIIKSMYYV